VRTVYRDIATLVAQGAPIDGEAGIGYLLRPGFTLPPLMFGTEEIEAIVLGSRWVAQGADEPLAKAARDALAKIRAVLPADLRERLETTGLLAAPAGSPVIEPASLPLIREAIRREQKLMLGYTDPSGQRTDRTVCPLALAFFNEVQVLAAWCELRDSFRHFRVDRIASLSPSEERFRGRRRTLLKAWRESQNIPEHVW